MKLLEIESLAIDSTTNDLVVLLKVVENNELLPIWIGNAEALSIALALAKVKPPRPLTHDLINSIIQGMNAKVDKIIISALINKTYYALIYLQTGEELVVVDARPSDSIAIATRVRAPIYMDDQIPTVSADENEDNRIALERRLRRIEPERIVGE